MPINCKFNIVVVVTDRVVIVGDFKPGDPIGSYSYVRLLLATKMTKKLVLNTSILSPSSQTEYLGNCMVSLKLNKVPTNRK